jgi:hypothetical protein
LPSPFLILRVLGRKTENTLLFQIWTGRIVPYVFSIGSEAKFHHLVKCFIMDLMSD